MRHVTKALGIILFAASACFGAFAQTPTSNAAASVNQRGMGNRFSPSVRTGNTTTVIGSESYTYAVPMFSLPGRHGLNLSLSLVYNNLIWTSSLGAGGVIYNFDSAYQPNGGTPSYGFRLDFGSLIWFTSSGSTSGLLIDATGGKHALIYSGSGNVYNTIDSTYISVQHTGGDQPSDVLTYKNGTQVFYHFAITNALGNITVTQPVKIEDSSGNFITINYAGGNQFTPPALSSVVDTVGRTLKFIYNNGLLSCVTDGTACGASGSRTFNFTWNTSYILNYNFSQIVFNSWSAANPLQGNNFPYTVLAGVTRPDGTQVKFNYGDWLIVNDIQEFSNNGTLRYETNYNFPLASAGQLSSPPAYTQQTATTFDKDGNSKQAIWSYQTVQSSPLPAEKIISCFAVTDPAGTIHITTFSSKGDVFDALPIQAATATGSSAPCTSAPATVLRSINTQWTSDTDAAGNLTGRNPRAQTITTILSDGITQSQTQIVAYDTHGNPTDVQQFDFGSGNPGPLLREAVATYATNLGNIFDLPTDLQVKDGSGNVLAHQTFTYDNYETTPLQTVNPLPQGFDNANFGGTTSPSRGNLTAATVYANASAGTGAINSTFAYDILGNMLTSQDGCCKQATASYSAVTQYAYPDSISIGPSGNQLTTSIIYNLSNGRAATITDSNGLKTQLSYDIADRPTNTTTPDNLTTTITYDDAAANPAVTFSSTASSLTTKSVRDFMGRSLLTGILNGNSVVSTTAYINDLAGRPVQISNPYGPGDTALYTNYVYDGLSRMTSVTRPSLAGTVQNSSQFQYVPTTFTDAAGIVHSGLSVQTTDPAGKSVLRYEDALGRLVRVDEPNGSSIGTSSTASVTVSGLLQPAIGAGSTPGLPATRIQTSGGSSKIKYFFSAGGASQNGATYSFSVTVKNQGQTAVKLAGNFVDGPVVQPGTTQSVNFTGMGDGVNIAQLLFETLNVGDSMDIVASSPAIAKTSDGINLIPLSNQNFASGWTAWSGAVATLTQGQTLSATRIQTSGGTSNIKYFFSVGGPSQNGVSYSFSVTVRNQGLTSVKLAGNFVDGPVIQPGTTQSVSFAGMGDGVDIAQLLFETLNAGDAMDVVAFAPAIAKVSDGINLIPSASQNFSSGWTAWSGAVATLTQAQTVPATRIQTSGGTSNIKYFFSASGASQSGVRYSFGVTVRNRGAAAVKLAGNFVDGPVIQPGTMQVVNFTGMGDGVDIPQLLFETLNPGDAMDVIAFAPTIAKTSDGINLIPSSSQNFSSGWSSWSGDVATLTQGRTDVGTVDEIDDAGTVSLAVGGFSATACYGNSINSTCNGQPVNNTSSQLASTLAQALNVSGSPVTAGISGSTISLTWRETGPNTTAVAALISIADNPALFPSSSFSSQPANFSGGQGPSLSNPNSTFYSYNAQGQLLQVKQGQQTRTYQLDSLGRVTSSTIPETNYQAATATYTDFGAVSQIIDPRVLPGTTTHITTTFAYDPLNRLKTVTYNDGTPSVTFTYNPPQSGNNTGGRLVNITNGVASETYQYDIMGRPSVCSKSIGGQTYEIDYHYHTDGTLASITYPSGRIVASDEDSIGRLTQIKNNGSSLLTINSYNAAGQILTETFGNGIAGTYTYNNQMQSSSVNYANSTTTLLSLTYNYGGAEDNGQILGITDGVTPSRSTSYIYDALGRLLQAQTNDLTSPNTWQLQFAYDRYGNRVSQIPTGGTANMPSNQVGIEATTNRINSAGYSHDDAGNMTGDGLFNYTFNGANQMTSVLPLNSTTPIATFSYDAAGLRVVKNNTVYIYSGRKVIAEYASGAAANAPNVEHIYRGRTRLATITAGVITYHYGDHLSRRADADANGNPLGSYGHYPYGETWYQTGTIDKWKFTNYENDSESGLNYAGARFHSPRLGRFMSLDRRAGSRHNPQSLNRYAYVVNDPINLIDPTGNDDSSSDDPPGGVPCENTFVGCGDTPPLPDDPPVNWNDLPDAPTPKPDCCDPPSTVIEVNMVFSALSFSDIPDDSANSTTGTLDSNSGESDAFVEGSLAYEVFGPPSRKYWSAAYGTVEDLFIGYTAVFGGGGTVLTVGPTLLAVGTGWYYSLGGIGTTAAAVLGRYPEYIEEAEEMGARVLNMPGKLWNFLDNLGESWTANRVFLDRLMAKGTDIYLASPLSRATFDTNYWLELQYLGDKLNIDPFELANPIMTHLMK